MGFTTSTAAYMSLAGQAGGALTSAVGSYYSAQSQQSTLDYQARMAEINARMSESSAQQELLRGQREAASVSLKAGHLKSSQRATMAANGIDLGEGSAAEILTSTDVMKEIDMNTVTANAVRSAWGYRAQATNYQNEALTKRASADTISPFASAATSLLGSAGSLSTSYYTMQKAGAFAAAAPSPSMPDFMRGGR